MGYSTDIIDCVSYAKEKGVLDIHITTNGLLLTDDLAKGLVENGLNLLVLSYDRYHMKASSLGEVEYTAFMQNVSKKVDRLRSRTRQSQLKIRVQSCVDDYSSDNIAKETYRISGLFPEADFILINPVYESYAVRPHLMNMEEYYFYPCSYLWQRLTIYADGTVTTCSRDYDAQYNRIGNVNSNSIYDLWHSTRLREMRKKHLHGGRKAYQICAVCENYLIHKKYGQPGSGCTGLVYDIEEKTH